MSFWTKIKECWRDMVLLPDPYEEDMVTEPKKEEKDTIYIDHTFKYDTVMRSLDNKLKEGFPVKSGFSLIVTTEYTAIQYLSNSKLHFKLRCLEPADKQFILKKLNYDKLILTVSNNDMLEIFNNALLPLTETIRCTNPRDYAKPGDIICFEDSGYLYVFQYRGEYLLDKDILDASFSAPTLLENNGPNAMKLSYIRSMVDTNEHMVYQPKETWMDILSHIKCDNF